MASCGGPPWPRRARCLGFLFLVLAASSPVGARDAQAEKQLAATERSGDSAGFLQALARVAAGDDAASVKAAVSSYARIAAQVEKKEGPGGLLAFHGQAALALKGLKSREAGEELQKQLTSAPDWRGRLLVLDASGSAKALDRLTAAKKALGDSHPVVVRRALAYLQRTKDTAIVEAILQRYLDVSKKKPREGTAEDWERARWAFQACLKRILHVDLQAPEDYRNYYEVRKGSPKLFDPPTEKKDSVSQVTLFGAAVTGKNIIFVLDTSGSMTSRDPLPPGAEREQAERPRTIVVDRSKAEKRNPNEPPPERERMLRAKKELASVVRALPSDVHFNIVDYSSDVRRWKPGLEPASDAGKKSALAYIEALKAEGITVTDSALETAFADLSADTIYLITDGAPTHVGNTTPGPGLPEDSLQLIGEIQERVREINFLRGVRIFTLGFEGAHEKFLQELAAENNGSYVSIR